MWFIWIVLIDIYFLVLKTSLSDKQMGFIRQNRSKNVDKREAEGSFLGVWVPKHIYSDTSIFLSCSTQWSGSFETKFVIFIHYGQFLQSLKHHCPPVWDHDNSKIGFLRLFVNKLYFDWSECGFSYCTHRKLSFSAKIKPLWHCNGILWGKICLKNWLKGRPKVVI